MSSAIRIVSPPIQVGNADFSKALKAYKQELENYQLAREEYAASLNQGDVPVGGAAPFDSALSSFFQSIVNSAATAKRLREITAEIKRRIRLYLKMEKTVESSVTSLLEIKRNERDILCFAWNCCGLQGQTVKATSHQFCLIDLIVLFEPDVLLLSEIKAKDEDVKAVVNGLPGYNYISISSCASKESVSNSNPPFKGGCAIIFRDNMTIKHVDKRSYQEDLSDGEAPDIEAIAVDIGREEGDTYRIINSYVRGPNKNLKRFKVAEKISKELTSPHFPTILAGDLNMHKVKDNYLTRWKNIGFFDSLKESWYTNKKGDSRTMIDYVMHNQTTMPWPLLCHKPIEPDNDSVHLLIPFTLGVNKNSVPYCTNDRCFLKCTK